MGGLGAGGSVHVGSFASHCELQLPRIHLYTKMLICFCSLLQLLTNCSSCMFRLRTFPMSVSFSMSILNEWPPPHPITALQAVYTHTHKNQHRPRPSLSPPTPRSSLLPPHFEVPFSNLLEEDQTGCKTESLIN